MRIVQISDTHLSVEHPHFAANNAALKAHLAGLKPDLIVHTGDLSMDGAAHRRDLQLARTWNDELPAEVLSIPGNHDVGDLISNRPDQPVNDERLRQWRDIIGPDWWVHDQGGWRLIGLNAMVLGSGHEDEEAQYAWLESVLDDAKPVALFLHKPLCIDTLNEGPRGYWTVPPAPRARLLSLLAGKPVQLIGSGHLHIQRQRTIDDVHHVWSPAGSFVVGDMQEDLGGERVLGYVEHTLGDTHMESRCVRPDGMKEAPLDPVRDVIYSTSRTG